MTVRLAFSVAIQVDAEVLLIDEVLAVGDAAFQQKCFAEFHRLKDEGRTILFVTHDMGAVERFCDRAMLIEKGKMVDLGEPAAIARRYNELNFGRTVQHLERAGARSASATGGGRDRRVPGSRTRRACRSSSSATGRSAACASRRASHEAVEDPVFGFSLRNEVGTAVFATTTDLLHGPTGTLRGRARASIVRLSSTTGSSPAPTR